MNKNSKLILQNLIRTTSGFNVIRFSKDSNEKRRIVRRQLILLLIYIVLFAYSSIGAFGYVRVGLTDYIPTLNAFIILICEFFFSVTRVKGYLFGYKGYERLITLPFSIKEIATSRFWYLYLQNLPIALVISLSMEASYGVYTHPDFSFYIVWTMLAFIYPMIPMAIAIVVGTAITFIGIHNRFRKVVRIVLTLSVCIFPVLGYLFIQWNGQNRQVSVQITALLTFVNTVTQYFLPIEWFTGAVINGKITNMVLIMITSMILYELTVTLITYFYRRINTCLMDAPSAHIATGKEIKKRNIIRAIAFNEYRRFMYSPTYLMNMILGPIIAVILAVVTFFVDLNSLLQPYFLDIRLLIPLLVYFCTGLASSTAITPSLEGKAYWLLRTLPLKKEEIIKGKMLFNLYLQVPCSAICCICFGYNLGAGTLNIFLYLLFITALCLFSTTLGMICGLKFLRLDWDNEVEVIKQGAALGVYFVINMIIIVALVALTLILNTIMRIPEILLVLSGVSILFSIVCYRLCMVKDGS